MFVMHVCMCVYDQTLNANYTYDTFIQADQFGNLADPLYWQWYNA